MKTKLKDLLVNDWKNVLNNALSDEYFIDLEKQLYNLYEHKTVYPPYNQLFNAFNLSSFSNTKVVIIGQDPYHQAGQAHGLAFSVKDGIAFPPSLKNIFKEIDLSFSQVSFRSTGNLTKWAKQGVLLLNATLTVEDSAPNVHAKLGWNELTIKAIQSLNESKMHLVFMLWGNFAIQFEKYIDTQKHLILKASHPSPLSANKGGWFGNNCFKLCNEYLTATNQIPIDWNE